MPCGQRSVRTATARTAFGSCAQCCEQHSDKPNARVCWSATSLPSPTPLESDHQRAAPSRFPKRNVSWKPPGATAWKRCTPSHSPSAYVEEKHSDCSGPTSTPPTGQSTHAVSSAENGSPRANEPVATVTLGSSFETSRRELLRTHRAQQLREQLSAEPRWTDSGLIFTTPAGTPIDPDNFARYFHRICEKAELGHWTPHELRHSAASIMLAQGTPLWVVSEVLGHASVAITKDVYGHLIGSEKQEATEAITDVLFNPGAPGIHRR